VTARRVEPERLAGFIGSPFPDMVKFVVDVEQRLIALGGELHADAEALLIDRECRQEALWGGNYFPGAGEADCIVYTSLINIRPAQGNPSMVLQDPKLRERVREIVFALVGRGEPLR
jgi:hypothetical protein